MCQVGPPKEVGPPRGRRRKTVERRGYELLGPPVTLVVPAISEVDLRGVRVHTER